MSTIHQSVIDPETVTRGLTYLYRLWLQAEMGLVAEAYVRKGGQATLICRDWVLAGCAQSIPGSEVENLISDLKRPIHVLCPSLPAGASGYDLSTNQARSLHCDVATSVEILRREQEWLRELGEEKAERDEWWRTRDVGQFKVWKGKAHRLLFYPDAGDSYGYSLNQGDGGGYFFFVSKSCKEEGRCIHEGAYKFSEHAMPSTRQAGNIDLLFSDGSVLLLHLTPARAGFKVFSRRVPAREGTLE